jgi:hypothetical protein
LGRSGYGSESAKIWFGRMEASLRSSSTTSNRHEAASFQNASTNRSLTLFARVTVAAASAARPARFSRSARMARALYQSA